MPVELHHLLGHYLNRPHPPHSRAQHNFIALRFICAAFAVRECPGDPRVVPGFRCTFLPGIPSPKPTAPFTSRLSAARSPSPLLDMTTASTGLLCWRDFHPLEWQLASLHVLSLSYRSCCAAEPFRPVPVSVVSRCSKLPTRSRSHSISSSARASREGGTLNPI